MTMLVRPLNNLIVTSVFGPRPKLNQNTGLPGPLHPGLDFGAPFGEPIFSVCDGKVIDSRPSPNDPQEWRPGDPPPKVMGYGNIISIVGDDGVVYRYAHMFRRLVEKGARVKAGEHIASVGSTGYSFGPHLHFEVRPEGGRALVDPLPLLAHLHPVTP